MNRHGTVIIVTIYAILTAIVIVKQANKIEDLGIKVAYLMETADHQAQIDSVFMRRIDYLLEETNFPMSPEDRKLLLYRGKD